MNSKSAVKRVCLVLLLSSAVMEAAEEAEKPKENQQPPDAVLFTPQSAISAMEKGLDPFKRHDLRLEKITDPVIVKHPVIAFHFIMQREYMSVKHVRTGTTNELGKREIKDIPVEKTEWADILVIPKDTGFLIENARKMDEEMEPLEPELRRLYLKKYGLLWQKSPSEFLTETAYLGEDANYYYFARANLSVLNWIQIVLKLENGTDLLPVMLRALHHPDHENFSIRFAITAIPRFGNRAIPGLVDAINSDLELDQVPYAPFQALRLIQTPEAVQMIVKFSKSRKKELLQGLFQALVDAPPQKEFLPVYLRMIETRMAPLYACNAVKTLHAEQEALPLLQAYIETPDSFDEYSFGVWQNFLLRNQKSTPKHRESVSRIRALLVRNGDIPNTLRFYNVNDNDSKHDMKLAEQDQKRIKEYTDQILNAAEVDLSIVSAFELAITNTKVKGVTPAYLLRVRDIGNQLLSQLPKAKVLRAFRTLLQNVKDRDERMLIQEAYQKYNKLK